MAHIPPAGLGLELRCGRHRPPLLWSFTVTEEAVAQTREVLSNPELREKMVDHNYETAKLFFSYSVLQSKLKNLIGDVTSYTKRFQG